MIKRATILKLLKQANKYEKRFFTLKKAELLKIAQDLGIDLTENGEQPVKKKVQIQEFSDSDSECDSECETDKAESDKDDEKAEAQTVVVKQKIKRSKIDVSKQYSPTDKDIQKDRLNTANTLLKNFAQDIRELLCEYDVPDLDSYDEQLICDTYNELHDNLTIKLDTLISQGEFNQTEINKLEKKLDTQKNKVERFLS